MSTDYAAKEREFLDSLKADTGRDLAAWMEAIRAAGLPHRNDIIDWLRQQGFMFSRASWLERIHNNGGKPIYADQPPTRRPSPRQPRPFPRVASAQSANTSAINSQSAEAPAAVAPPPATQPRAVQSAPPPAPAQPAVPRPFPVAARQRPTVEPTPAPPVATPAPTTRPPAPNPPALAVAPSPVSPTPPALPAPPALAPLAGAESVADVLARAKAFRPLAQYLLREIEKAVPGTRTGVRDGLVTLSNPREYAVVLATTKDVRLGLDLGDRPAAGPLLRAKIAGAAPHITHMLVLDDARQLDAHLAELIRASDLNAKARAEV